MSRDGISRRLSVHSPAILSLVDRCRLAHQAAGCRRGDCDPLFRGAVLELWEFLRPWLAGSMNRTEYSLLVLRLEADSAASIEAAFYQLEWWLSRAGVLPGDGL